MSAGLIQLMELGNPAFRGVLVGALMLLIGAPPTLSFVVLPELERRGLDTTRAHQVPLPVMGVTLVGATFAGTALAIENAQAADIASFAAWAGSTSAGQAWLVFVAVAIVLGGLTTGRHVISGHISWRLWLGTVFVGAFAMLVTFCWTRFSTAVDIPAVAILVKLGHMMGGALWVGGLAVLAVLPRLVPRDTDSDDDTDMARIALAVVRRFSIVAVSGVTIAFATGVIIAAWHVPTLTALATTPYGILLSVKVGLVVIAAMMGGFNRLVLHEQIAYSVRESSDAAVLPGLLAVADPGIAADDAVATITRSIRLELAVLVVAIGLSVALTTAVTPSYELLEPAVATSGDIVRSVVPFGFATLLKAGAIGIGLAGSLALGYEVGKFSVARQ